MKYTKPCYCICDLEVNVTSQTKIRIHKLYEFKRKPTKYNIEYNIIIIYNRNLAFCINGQWRSIISIFSIENTKIICIFKKKKIYYNLKPFISCSNDRQGRRTTEVVPKNVYVYLYTYCVLYIIYNACLRYLAIIKLW